VFVREGYQGMSHKLEAPEWDAFFRAPGSAASKTAFDLLARGPQQRS